MDKDNFEEWAPDDECDALNDETFGDEGGEYCWEQNQSMADDFGGDKGKPNGKSEQFELPHHEVPRSISMFNHPEGHYNYLDGTSDGSIPGLKPSQLDDFEAALEASISRLVMDDLDEEDVETAKSQLLRLGGGGAGTSLNTYFMPPQVANRHLQWQPKELAGEGSSLFGSVWSMHPTGTDTAKTSAAASRGVPTGEIKGMSQSELLMKKHAIDRMMEKKIPPDSADMSRFAHPIPMSPPKKPVFKTVEEIERELLEGTESVEVTNHSVPAPDNNIVNHAPGPRILTAEELERDLMESAQPQRSFHQVAPPLQDFSNQSGAPSSEQIVRHMVPGSPIVPVPPMRFPPPVNMNPLLLQRLQSQHPYLPPAMAQRMMVDAQLHHPRHPGAGAQFAIQQHQHLRMMQMNPQLRGPMMMPIPMMSQVRPGFGVPHPHHLLPGQMHMLRNMRPGDPYVGLMNEKDKQRLRNIAIIQLQNDHPYPTDYYSLMFKAKRSSDPKHTQGCLLKLFPHRSDDNASKNNYQPAHFENSLGKLQAVSALAPKKAIDTVIRVVDSGTSNRKGVKAYRYLLLEIEKLYEILLKIQEAQIRQGFLHNADESTILQKNENEDKVKRILNSPEKLNEILAIHKGKMLVCRLMPLIGTEFKIFLLTQMIRTFNDWFVVEKEEVDRVYTLMRHCIMSLELSHIVTVFCSHPREVYENMLSKKLGVSLLLACFHRAEVLINASSENDPQAEYFTILYFKNAETLMDCVSDTLYMSPRPIEVPPRLKEHFEKTNLSVEKQLNVRSAIFGWRSEPDSVPMIVSNT